MVFRLTPTNGNVDFLDSEIDLSLIDNLELSLGAINILDGLFIVDLPDLQLGAVAQGLDTVLSGVPNLALNQLQSVMEPAISVLLLNPLDPLSLGEVVKDFIMAMEHNTPVALPGELLGGTNPDFRFRSKISTLEFSAATTKLAREVWRLALRHQSSVPVKMLGLPLVSYSATTATAKSWNPGVGILRFQWSPIST